jgi:hypothetical protein
MVWVLLSLSSTRFEERRGRNQTGWGCKEEFLSRTRLESQRGPRAQCPGFLFRDVLESLNPCGRTRIPRSSRSPRFSDWFRNSRPGAGSLGVPHPTLLGVGGVTWCLGSAPFLAFWGSGFRNRGPQATRGWKKGLCALGAQSNYAWLSPCPQRKPEWLFFRGVCVAWLREPRGAS